MTQLAFDRFGAGPPLLVLHALGLSRRAWDPVVLSLAEHFEVIAVDLPGCGESPPLPAGVEPTPAVLAETIGELLDDLGISEPHVVGNSLGGWVALELAGIRSVASLTLLSPAGLWRHHTPIYVRVSLRTSHWLARRAGRLLCRLVRYRVGRVLVLGQTHGRPMRMTAERARRTIRELGPCPGFDATLAATTHRRYLAGAAHNTPITVAFGSRDLLLLRRQSRHFDQLPAHTQVRELTGCGHIPMTDDPDALVALITETTSVEVPVNSGRQR